VDENVIDAVLRAFDDVARRHCAQAALPWFFRAGASPLDPRTLRQPGPRGRVLRRAPRGDSAFGAGSLEGDGLRVGEDGLSVGRKPEELERDLVARQIRRDVSGSASRQRPPVG